MIDRGNNRKRKTGRMRFKGKRVGSKQMEKMKERSLGCVISRCVCCGRCSEGSRDDERGGRQRKE